MSAEEFRIECCAAAYRANALRLLHAGLSPDQQTALPPALDAVRSQGGAAGENAGENAGDAAFSGLLVANNPQKLMGVVWVQLAPGRTAVVWPPAIGGAASSELMRAAADFLDDRRVVLAQILVSPDAPHDSEMLAAGDFRRLIELEYLTVQRDLFPTATPRSELQFAASASDEPQRLGRLLLETYEQTLDCPQLNGLRESADILAGYAAQGQFSADRWFFVQQAGRDVGTLILTEYPDGETWELVYMGVVPAARGNGFGRQIVNFALAQAGVGGAGRLVLAVDRANAPALAMYHAAGFVDWDRRTVYARLNRQ